MTTKECTKCKLGKPLTDFYKDLSTKDKVTYMCKTCCKAITYAWRKANPLKVSLQSSRRHFRNPEANAERISIYNHVHPLKTIIRSSRWNAAKRGLPFDLTEAYLLELLKSQNNVCAISGLPFWKERAKGSKHPYRMSIDKIIPELGYVKGNVRLVLWAINIGMSTWGLDIYVEVAKAVLTTSTYTVN